MSFVRLIAAVLLFAACDSASEDEPAPETVDRRAALKAAQTWMYQLAALDVPDALETLAATDYPLLVLEPGNNHLPCVDGSDEGACADPYDAAAMVAALRETPDGQRRLLLAYIDIGQAERWRTYWASDWAPPTADGPGQPDFILTEDPDGWAGNYPVAFWRPEWQALWNGPDGLVAELARLGFDGVYLDWVEAYDDETVAAVAQAEGKDGPQ